MIMKPRSQLFSRIQLKADSMAFYVTFCTYWDIFFKEKKKRSKNKSEMQSCDYVLIFIERVLSPSPWICHYYINDDGIDLYLKWYENDERRKSPDQRSPTYDELRCEEG